MRFCLVIITIFALQRICSGQHLYYRYIAQENIDAFADTTHKIVIFSKDSSQKYTNHFKYALKFFPNIQFKKIEVAFKPGLKVAKIRPAFLCFFQAPQNRKYKITLSSGTSSELDSVILKNLETNSQVGLIARQISQIEDLTTSGFFDILGWHFKQLSKKMRKKLKHEAELHALEVGFGYQMQSLAKDEEEKLKIDNWKNAKAYAYYAKRYKNVYLSSEDIKNFISDLPIYVSQTFK